MLAIILVNSTLYYTYVYTQLYPSSLSTEDKDDDLPVIEFVEKKPCCGQKEEPIILDDLPAQGTTQVFYDIWSGKFSLYSHLSSDH